MCTHLSTTHKWEKAQKQNWFVFIPARRQCARRRWRWCWDCIRSASHGPVASPAKRCLRSSRRKTRLYHRHLYKYWFEITTVSSPRCFEVEQAKTTCCKQTPEEFVIPHLCLHLGEKIVYINLGAIPSVAHAHREVCQKLVQLEERKFKN